MPKRSSDKPSQESYTLAEFGQSSPLVEAQELVLDAVILEPATPAAQLANSVFHNAESDFVDRLAAVLIPRFLTRLIWAARRRQSAVDHAQYVIPGFEHLPHVIRISPDGQKTVELMQANTRGVREYYRLLMKEHRQRKENDPRVQEARALLKLMQKHSVDSERITVRQVLLLEEL